MKITPDRLAVARAVRKQIESRVAEYPRKGLLLSDIRHLNLDAIIVAIPEPEPEPLPAPTEWIWIGAEGESGPCLGFVDGKGLLQLARNIVREFESAKGGAE